MEQIDAILVWIVMLYFTQGMPRNAVWLIFTMAEMGELTIRQILLIWQLKFSLGAVIKHLVKFKEKDLEIRRHKYPFTVIDNCYHLPLSCNIYQYIIYKSMCIGMVQCSTCMHAKDVCKTNKSFFVNLIASYIPR